MILVRSVKLRAHVFVNGMVQGVFFRYETERKARQLGVLGWVRNLRDGRVEVMVEGEEEPMKRLVAFLRQGPSGAKVTDVAVTWGRYIGEFHSFEVRFTA